jgi:hypothetical protein
MSAAATTRPIHELLADREAVRAELLNAQDRVDNLTALLHDLERSLRKAGWEGDTEPLPTKFDDMSISIPPFKVKAGSVFREILAQVDHWMSERELFARANSIGLKESTAGDFKRSLAAFQGIRRRRSDGYIGLREWPDDK